MRPHETQKTLTPYLNLQGAMVGLHERIVKEVVQTFEDLPAQLPSIPGELCFFFPIFTITSATST